MCPGQKPQPGKRNTELQHGCSQNTYAPPVKECARSAMHGCEVTPGVAVREEAPALPTDEEGAQSALAHAHVVHASEDGECGDARAAHRQAPCESAGAGFGFGSCAPCVHAAAGVELTGDGGVGAPCQPTSSS